MLWKTFGQCWAGCGIPLHLPILGAGKYAHRPPLPSCSTQSPCISHFYQLKAAVRPKVASLYAARFLFIFNLTLYFTSSVGSRLTCRCTKHLAPLLSRSLHVFSSSISNHTHTQTHPRKHADTHTHTHIMGLRFRGSYDTIQILIAAYAGKCVLCKALRSPDFPCQAALIHMAQGGLCQQSYVSAGGPVDPHSVTHSSLSLTG